MLNNDEILSDNKQSIENINLNKKFNIGIIIPTSSNKKGYSKLEDYIFINFLIPSFLETSSFENNYNFYLGYDEDDVFFRNNLEELIKYFEPYKDKFNISFTEMIDLKGKVGKIWSNLAEISSKKDDYILQIGDDVKFLDKNWDKYMIQQLLHTDNIGIVGPYDFGIKNSLLTQSFVHGKTHLEIFKTYFPESIINHNIDSWITHVYGGLGDINFKIINLITANDVRYQPVSNQKTYLNQKSKDLLILNSYLNDKSKIKIYNFDSEMENLEEKLLTVCVIKNSDNDMLLRLLNKILISGIKYDYFNILIGDNMEKMYKKISSKYITFISSRDLISNDYFFEISQKINDNFSLIDFIETTYKLEFTKRINYLLIRKNLYKSNAIIRCDIFRKFFGSEKILTKQLDKICRIKKFMYHRYT